MLSLSTLEIGSGWIPLSFTQCFNIQCGLLGYLGGSNLCGHGNTDERKLALSSGPCNLWEHPESPDFQTSMADQPSSRDALLGGHRNTIKNFWVVTSCQYKKSVRLLGDTLENAKSVIFGMTSFVRWRRTIPSHFTPKLQHLHYLKLGHKGVLYQWLTLNNQRNLFWLRNAGLSSGFWIGWDGIFKIGWKWNAFSWDLSHCD